MAFCLIAHRAGPGIYPEQSIASAREAYRSGADMAEMDVQFTSDGIPVICHDPNTLRMFGEDSLCSDITLEHFLSLRHSEYPEYPSHSLANVLASGIKPLLLHQKCSGEQLRAMMRVINEYGYGHDVVIGVQHPDDVALIRDMLPETKVLAFMPHVEDMDAFLDANADIIRLWEGWVTKERIDHIHGAGRSVWIMAGECTQDGVGYTTEENFISWIDMGVDGILINDVPWAASLCGR